MRSVFLFALLAVGASCTEKVSREKTEVDAFVPTYVKIANPTLISTQGPTTTKQPGKIYAYNNYVFQNDVFTGFHVIDKTDPANPKKVAFINVPQSSEISIKGNYLYTNNVSDLVVLNIADPLHPVLMKRIKDAFPVINQNRPPGSGYFECVDPEKGLVIGWELKRITQPKCRL